MDAKTAGAKTPDGGGFLTALVEAGVQTRPLATPPTGWIPRHEGREHGDDAETHEPAGLETTVAPTVSFWPVPPSFVPAPAPTALSEQPALAQKREEQSRSPHPPGIPTKVVTGRAGEKEATTGRAGPGQAARVALDPSAPISHPGSTPLPSTSERIVASSVIGQPPPPRAALREPSLHPNGTKDSSGTPAGGEDVQPGKHGLRTSISEPGTGPLSAAPIRRLESRPLVASAPVAQGASVSSATVGSVPAATPLDIAEAVPAAPRVNLGETRPRTDGRPVSMGRDETAVESTANPTVKRVPMTGTIREAGVTADEGTIRQESPKIRPPSQQIQIDAFGANRGGESSEVPRAQPQLSTVTDIPKPLDSFRPEMAGRMELNPEHPVHATRAGRPVLSGDVFPPNAPIENRAASMPSEQPPGEPVSRGVAQRTDGQIEMRRIPPAMSRSVQPADDLEIVQRGNSVRVSTLSMPVVPPVPGPTVTAQSVGMVKSLPAEGLSSSRATVALSAGSSVPLYDQIDAEMINPPATERRAEASSNGRSPVPSRSSDVGKRSSEVALPSLSRSAEAPAAQVKELVAVARQEPVRPDAVLRSDQILSQRQVPAPSAPFVSRETGAPSTDHPGEMLLPRASFDSSSNRPAASPPISTVMRGPVPDFSPATAVASLDREGQPALTPVTRAEVGIATTSSPEKAEVRQTPMPLSASEGSKSRDSQPSIQREEVGGLSGSSVTRHQSESHVPKIVAATEEHASAPFSQARQAGQSRSSEGATQAAPGRNSDPQADVRLVSASRSPDFSSRVEVAAPASSGAVGYGSRLNEIEDPALPSRAVNFRETPLALRDARVRPELPSDATPKPTPRVTPSAEAGSAGNVLPADPVRPAMRAGAETMTGRQAYFPAEHDQETGSDFPVSRTRPISAPERSWPRSLASPLPEATDPIRKGAIESMSVPEQSSSPRSPHVTESTAHLPDGTPERGQPSRDNVKIIPGRTNEPRSVLESHPPSATPAAPALEKASPPIPSSVGVFVKEGSYSSSGARVTTVDETHPAQPGVGPRSSPDAVFVPEVRPGRIARPEPQVVESASDNLRPRDRDLPPVRTIQPASVDPVRSEQSVMDSLRFASGTFATEADRFVPRTDLQGPGEDSKPLRATRSVKAPDAGGIPAAQTDTLMKNAANRNEIAGRTPQDLPVVPARPEKKDAFRSLAASGIEVLEARPASTHASRPTISEFESASHLESSSRAMTKSLEIASLMDSEVKSFKRARAEMLDVVLRPERSGEVHVQLRWRDGHIEASVRVAEADYAALNAGWSQFQERMAQQGVKVFALEESRALPEPSLKGSTPDAQSRQSSGDSGRFHRPGESMERGHLSSPAASDPAPRPAPRSRAGGNSRSFESWA